MEFDPRTATRTAGSCRSCASTSPLTASFEKFDKLIRECERRARKGLVDGVKIDVARQYVEKLDDRWLGPLMWLSKSDRGNELLVAAHVDKAPAIGRSIRRFPVRWR